MRIDKLEIEQKALRIRQENNILTCGIKDIFSVIAQVDVDLIRYPFGQDQLLGFATCFEGRRIIVSNSSEILSREIFTIAHELGHIVFDFDDDGNVVKIDKEFVDDNQDISEARAHYFASCLLMPEEQIEKFVKYELKKTNNQINALDIVRIQIEFQVSYAAAVVRLFQIGMINSVQKSILFNDRNNLTSKAMFHQLEADEQLLKPSDLISIPPNFLEYVTSNYENGYIPFSSLEKALLLVGMDASVFKKESISSSNEDCMGEKFLELH